MNHEAMIATIHRHLPRLKRRDVAEVLEVMQEQWLKTLCKGESITVGNLGKLVVEVQHMKAGGVLKQYRTLKRLYVRFRPTAQFRRALLKEGSDE
jgi:nucleoid DNA-binding protein